MSGNEVAINDVQQYLRRDCLEIVGISRVQTPLDNHRAECYCLSRHILAVLSFSMPGIIVTKISCRNSDCSRQ